MTQLDLFDDLIEVFVIVLLACDEIEVARSIFLVIMLTFDLGAKRTGVELDEPWLTHLFQIVDLFRAREYNHRILTEDNKNIVHFVTKQPRLERSIEARFKTEVDAHLHGRTFAIGEIIFLLPSDDHDRVGRMQCIVVAARCIRFIIILG